MGEEWDRAIDRRNWILLTENVVRDKREEEKDNEKRESHGQLNSDDSDAKNIIKT